MKTTVERAERFFNDTPIKPIRRETIDGIEVRFADGFITPEMYRGAQLKFGIAPDEETHPFGCYATVWWADIGRVACPGGVGYSSDTDQHARFLAMRERAQDGLRKEKKKMRALNG